MLVDLLAKIPNDPFISGITNTTPPEPTYTTKQSMILAINIGLAIVGLVFLGLIPFLLEMWWRPQFLRDRPDLRKRYLAWISVAIRFMVLEPSLILVLIVGVELAVGASGDTSIGWLVGLNGIVTVLCVPSFVISIVFLTQGMWKEAGMEERFMKRRRCC
ncbi:hypothetical protein HDU98_002806 [Podochytrium sp. JEL0797]|nr:hypothetical protein HDU98_002806 [Podochytrium sp. JEL0797]